MAIKGSVGKMLVPLLTFAVIVGGWWLLQLYQARQLAQAPLPDEGGRQGNCVLWFIGSSSVYRWKTLGRDMHPWIAHNRGIEGATFAEIAPRFAHEAQRTAPEAIILYAGENDIAGGGTAAQAVRDLEAFLVEKTAKFGQTPVFVVSMKPSPTRWRFFPELSRYNAAASRIAMARSDVTYVNVVPLLLVNGKPGDFYRADGIHMNDLGYSLWAAAIRDALRRFLPSGVASACDPPISGRVVPAVAAAAH